MTGIYKITSNKSDKVYIGSAVNFRKRRDLHLFWLRRNKHHSIHLQRHVNKHGLECLSFELIEECDKSVLLEREQYYLDSTSNLFNMLKFAGNTKGWKHRPESLAIMSAKSKAKIVTDEERRKKSIASKGRIRSKETCLKLSLSLKGKKKSKQHLINIGLAGIGRVTSLETRFKINNSMKIFKVAQMNMEGEVIKVHESSLHASIDLNIPKKSIQKVCRGRYKTTNGYKFKYIPYDNNSSNTTNNVNA